jgi:hypothetical protein
MRLELSHPKLVNPQSLAPNHQFVSSLFPLEITMYQPFIHLLHTTVLSFGPVTNKSITASNKQISIGTFLYLVVFSRCICWQFAHPECIQRKLITKISEKGTPRKSILDE